MAGLTGFDFQTAQRIVFGSGVAAHLPQLARGYGERLFMVTGSDSDDVHRVSAALESEGLTVARRSIQGEPRLNEMMALVQELRALECQLVIGMGGGSALDSAKALAALAANPGDPLDYLEVVGKGLPFPNDPLPVIALPTTAGTGSEVTRNAVLGIPEKGVKVSLRSPKMLPVVALVDAQLTLSLPPALTASTGMDALTQLIEPYVSKRANAFTDMFCEAGIRHSVRSLRTAYRDGSHLSAREDLAFASLLSGLALANAGLGAAHGFAAPIGGMFAAPHGAVCARLLPPVCRVNIHAGQRRSDSGVVLARYQRIASWLTGNERALPLDGVDWLDALCADLNIPRLREYGIRQSDFQALIDSAAQASSMKANPFVLTPGELGQILAQAW